MKLVFLHRCLIITSWSQVPQEVFYKTSFLRRCLIITIWAQGQLEDSYELVSYIDVIYQLVGLRCPSKFLLY